MLKTYKETQDTIVDSRCRYISFDDNNEIEKYENWHLVREDPTTSFLNFPTSGGGVLFFPNCLSKTVLDEDLFKKLCPTSDDVWFWAMATMNNTKIKGVKNSYTKLTYVNLARELHILIQKILFTVNQFAVNDKHIENVLTEFPIIENIIKDA